MLNQQIEGGPRTKHGGNDDADNSGILRYVRVEFAGYPFQKDKEINGITFGSVGSGTTIDHLQVSYSNDDSYEWFGGNVNCIHNYIQNEEIKESKYRYIDELITRINEYNDILALWIKMRQGTLSLNIENFELNSLFDVLVKGRKTFEMKQQTLTIEPTAAIVKADKALTLFMINTLTENARKYTQPGGNVSVYAQETESYVEISVKDDGPGLSQEDVERILSEKVYDSGKIGLQTSEKCQRIAEE